MDIWENISNNFNGNISTLDECILNANKSKWKKSTSAKE